MNHEKDVKRFSYSRFKMFHNCPLKHAYQYIEQIEVPENKYTIPGKLFHEAIELYLNGKNYEIKLEEFEKLCRKGVLDLEPKLLEHVFERYIAYYAKEFESEVTYMIEAELTETLEGEDYLIIVVDEVYSRNGMNILRDRKTTLSKFKYDFDSVLYNSQLLLYVPYVEAKLGLKIDAIEIDEIKLAMLEAPPLNANGKPTIDKRKLDLVTREAYYAKLEELGLQGNKEYKDVLEYLEDRGHPLFKRVRVQLVDQRAVENNLQDLWNTYKAIKISPGPYRNRGPLCDYCPFKQLCDLDMTSPGESDRKIIINQLKSK